MARELLYPAPCLKQEVIMQTRRILCLTQPTIFSQPTVWEFHARYAVQRNGGEVRLPAGSWLVELDPVETWHEQKKEYRYRTPSGEVVALESPLEQHRYTEVTDPQVVTALNAYRSLETILADDFGMSLQQTCRELPPFALIQCPLCSGTSFTTLDLASAWCDRCNANFQVRSTAGDPGFVVDVTWAHYNPLVARYVVPRTEKLLSTLVLKDSRDPRDMSREHCCDECLSGPIQLTGGHSGLRPGLHRCQIGTLYDWRRIYGQVPALEELRDSWEWEIDGQGWPASATLRTLPLAYSERRALELAESILHKEHPGVAGEIKDILRVRTQPPSMFEAVLPDICNLQEGEHYLLHHWLTMRSGNPPDSFETALPVWYVVTPVIEDGYLSGWTVVRKDICPWCGEAVSPEDVAANQQGRNRWDIPHGNCREIWEKTGWRLPDSVQEISSTTTR
jgi:hypothetical protein